MLAQALANSSSYISRILPMLVLIWIFYLVWYFTTFTRLVSHPKTLQSLSTVLPTLVLVTQVANRDNVILVNITNVPILLCLRYIFLCLSMSLLRPIFPFYGIFSNSMHTFSFFISYSLPSQRFLPLRIQPHLYRLQLLHFFLRIISRFISILHYRFTYLFPVEVQSDLR